MLIPGGIILFTYCLDYLLIAQDGSTYERKARDYYFIEC